MKQLPGDRLLERLQSALAGARVSQAAMEVERFGAVPAVQCSELKRVVGLGGFPARLELVRGHGVVLAVECRPPEHLVGGGVGRRLRRPRRRHAVGPFSEFCIVEDEIALEELRDSGDHVAVDHFGDILGEINFSLDVH
ncbi:hypothetical protein ENSA7_07310 [Enhygromyxa salina]|uniref:Uncharacterized protein n=1 Tax=Enhygromyxa salina TaxID=215803 RepID=A0A2S9YWS0_9BACT|nr:hypothetical protein ENSA7_07310 [Enhygromyxa salina]